MPLTFFGGLGLVCFGLALLIGLPASLVPDLSRPAIAGVVAETLILLRAVLYQHWPHPSRDELPREGVALCDHPAPWRVSDWSAVPSFAADDLEVMSDAENYVRWIFSELVAPHLGRSVLEIGSGIGTFSSRIAADPADTRVARLICVEIDPTGSAVAREALAVAQARRPVEPHRW